MHRFAWTLLCAPLLALPVSVAAAQSRSGEAPALVPPLPPAAVAKPALGVDVSLMNAFDGNINRDAVPLQSFGLSPGANIRYQPAGPVSAEYGIALNEYTGTDRWDRVSHALSATIAGRRGRVHLETIADATWKVPSDDGELTRQLEGSERLTMSVSSRTSVQVVGAYRYKYYVEHPATSGMSPYAGATVDHRFGDRRLAVGYRFQTRESRLRSDRYHRDGYAASFSTPASRGNDQLSLAVEYRRQTFEGLVPVAGAAVPRRDGRVLASARYERPVGMRVSVLWLAGFQRRWSNDPTKRYSEPTFALTLRYRWR